MYSNILTSIEENILILTINRPEKMNALNSEVLTELEQAIDEATSNGEVKSVIITGSGAKAFVAGADISEFVPLSKDQAIKLAKRGQDIFFKIENSAKPVVAAVNGFALGGGCELAMACHFRLCSDNAKFGQPEVNLGLIPGYGGTQRLTMLVGKGKSMEMQMTGQLVDANEALRLGLVNYVTTAEALIDTTKKILQTIHTKAPVAISKVISSVNAFAGSTGRSGFDLEVSSFGECFDTADMKEGTQAFLEKRKANFTGR